MARARNQDGQGPIADAEAALSELEAAGEALADVEAEVDEHGEGTVRQLASVHERTIRLFDRYEETATGTGREQFQQYVRFQEEFASLVESVDDDLPAAGTFEEAEELFDRRTLQEKHFERAREILAPVGEFAELLSRRDEAETRVREATARANGARRALEERVDELERLVELGDADLDAPVERLREPIEAYDAAVRETFDSFKTDESARAVLGFVAATESYPLVDYRQPPRELVDYVESKPAGEEPIPTLLEYADYSPSKLDHYVDDVGALRTTVAVHRTYLERLDAEPLTIDWPPPAAGTLERRAEELVSLVGRFADEATVATLRAVRDLPRETDYERLRTAARSREDLGEAERERVQSGDLDRELERARSLLTDLEDAIDG
jgi:hypothetical protein